MSGPPKSKYYAVRALAERRMTEAAADPRAAAAHAELAARYEAAGRRPKSRVAQPHEDIFD
ncbi:MAG TPA: hypothetical protein VMN38_01530 [Sphingomicrobium sp.]|nr:hypothetical protein [Sphingomicrobium sp.]